VNWLDILLVIIIGYAVLAGFLRGFAREGIGLAAMIAGLICAFWFYGTVASFLTPYIRSREVASVLGFLLVFISVIVVGALLGRLISKLLRVAHLGFLDRLMGAGFGFVKGVLTSSIIVLLLMAFTPKPPPRSVVESRYAPYVVDTSRIIVSAAPHELKDGFQRSYAKVKQVWADAMKKGIRKPATDEI
jgi:membrane protein required for colicin V production